MMQIEFKCKRESNVLKFQWLIKNTSKCYHCMMNKYHADREVQPKGKLVMQNVDNPVIQYILVLCLTRWQFFVL